MTNSNPMLLLNRQATSDGCRRSDHSTHHESRAAFITPSVMPAFCERLHRLATVLCAVILAASGLPSALGGDWELVPDRKNQIEVSEYEGVIRLRTLGIDPFVVGKLANLKPDDRVLQFDYICPSGIDSLQVYVGPPFGAATSFVAPGCPKTENWKTHRCELGGGAAKSLAKKPQLMRIDFGRKPGVRFQVRNVALRPRSAKEIGREQKRVQARKVKTEEAERIADYLKATFPLEIESVSVKTDKIELTGGSIPKGASLAKLRLIEYPPWHSIGMKNAGNKVDVTFKTVGGNWQAVVPRKESGRDRLHSAWRLAYENGGETKFISSRRFATEIQPITSDFPDQPLRPTNQKGMGGIERNSPMDELIELGVTAITVNISLTAFIAHREATTHKRLDVPGKAVYFNQKAFDVYDSMIDWARKNDVVVTAIVLIPTVQRNRALNPLLHPENTGGTYAMPDIATERGSAIYAAVLDIVASRYSNWQRAPGGITNWIAHNEIDFHQQWTNMGLQPREIITETYYRSMRMISGTARQHNPHARVFTSTTHHWAVPDDGLWNNLSPRELLIALQRYTKVEGDFGWGVAYHPYSSKLRASLAWDKEDITDDFDTHRITMQNIQVLGRFLEHEFMLNARGKPRPVLLSEQGFHSVSYDEDDQANQAASLAYAMKKIRKMPLVESFHYHRWMDHPGEPGSFFGLRTLPSKTEKLGKKKRSWEVYQALGTPQEEEAIRGLPHP